MSSDRGIGTVFSDLAGEVAALVRNEIRLAKTEITEKIRSMLVGLVLAAVGVFLMIFALIFVLEAAVGGLMLLGLSFALSSLIVAVVGLLIGGVIVWLGVNRLKVGKLSESKTAQQFKRDAATVRAQVHAP